MKTINHLLASSCTRHADRPALSLAFEKPLSYGEMERECRRLAGALHRAGVRKGRRVAILAANSPQWALAYLATVRLGGVAVPILPDFHESDVRHIITASQPRVLFIGSQQFEKIVEIERDLPKHVVILDDTAIRNAPLDVIPLGAFTADAPTINDKLASLAGAVKPDDPASLIFTSGTSGHSKAVTLSHGNLVSNAEAAMQVVRIHPEMTFLSLLPLSHAYEFTCGFLTPLASGGRIVYAGARPSPTILRKICEHERPQAICVVPMIMEKIYKKRLLPELRRNRLLRFGLRLPGLRRRIYQKVGRKLLSFFGGRLEVMAIGGAPLNREVEEFLRRIEFPFLVGYGLTEAAPLVAAGPFGDPAIPVGSCGKPVPGVEVRIVNPAPDSGAGEILVKGPNVMLGYYENPELTKETIDEDGWLATGDLGYVDRGGNLFVIGRSKSVIVLSHGENIYPEAIEDRLLAYPLVAECLVIGRNDRLEALVYPDYDYVDRETAGAKETARQAFVAAALEEIRREVNAELPRYSHLARIVERQEPFIKTATQKIKRFLYA